MASYHGPPPLAGAPSGQASPAELPPGGALPDTSDDDVGGYPLHPMDQLLLRRAEGRGREGASGDGEDGSGASGERRGLGSGRDGEAATLEALQQNPSFRAWGGDGSNCEAGSEGVAEGGTEGLSEGGCSGNRSGVERDPDPRAALTSEAEVASWAHRLVAVEVAEGGPER
eukprot:608033-Prorocentrum_minimum.AAC.1